MAANITKKDSSKYQVPPDEHNICNCPKGITPDSDQASGAHRKSAGHTETEKHAELSHCHAINRIQTGETLQIKESRVQ